MLNPSMQELMKRVGNRYLLVNLAAQRARDIADEAEEKGESLPDTPAMHDSLENKPLYQRLWAQTTNPDREAVRRAQALS